MFNLQREKWKQSSEKKLDIFKRCQMSFIINQGYNKEGLRL